MWRAGKYGKLSRVETFNFSFFDEKPPADAGSSPAPAPEAPHPVASEDDPFAEFGFDLIENEAAPRLLPDDALGPVNSQHSMFPLTVEDGVAQEHEITPVSTSSPLAISSAQAEEAFRLDVASALDLERPDWAVNPISARAAGKMAPPATSSFAPAKPAPAPPEVAPAPIAAPPTPIEVASPLVEDAPTLPDFAFTLDEEVADDALEMPTSPTETVAPPVPVPTVAEIAPDKPEKAATKTGFAGYKLDDEELESAKVPASAEFANTFAPQETAKTETVPPPPTPELTSFAIEPLPPLVPAKEAPAPAPEIRAAVEQVVFLTPAAPLAPPVAKAAPTVVEETPAELVEAPAEAIETPASEPEGVRYATVDDPFAPIAPLRARLRVAVLGASGIGKDHARWLVKNGGEVISFLGSSAESVEGTRVQLAAGMGFEGQGFADLGELLTQTRPQAVVVASPSQFHYAQAMQCLEAGVHVLCEKPLVYSPGRSKRENMDGAKELLRAAAKRELVLATQLQYGGATPILCRLAGVSPMEVGDFAMEIETSNAKSPRDPKGLWIELASHPLSVAQYLAGEGAQILKDSVQLSPSRSGTTTEVFARFGVQCEGGRLLMCRAIVRWFDKTVDNRPPRRRFSFNGRVVQYAGVKGEGGSYIAQYIAPDGYISHYPDPVDYLVGNFVRTCWGEDDLILSAEQGVQNLDWLLTTADKIPV